ncbi:glycosyl hydrolase family 85-domain-containing protein, partial [Rhodotorula diobovata]
MVRSPAAGPAPVAAPPDYFDSLSELASYAAAPRPPRSRFAAPQVPLAHLAAQADDSKGRGKLLVCHDYKGGYSERDDERGYTFGWWHLVNTFIYFSHHRVSCPPAGWIRAAHQGGTKILGTLIFEHGAGRFDIVELVAPSSSGSSTAAPAFERLSTRYADSLVDLALERGIDGWLVNVEVELGGEGATGDQKRAHARALIAWLRYFSGEMRRRVPGGEVMWYDAVTTDGQLAWQNALTERNLPFFTACDSIFLNYWWRGDQLASTAALLDRLGSGRRQDVYFGIDVFGRGTLAGGGFEAWRAVHKIEQRLGTGAEGSSFSTALFAPGWTVEAESLSHSLSSPEAFARWQTDDDFLFSRTTPTPSVAPEAARHDRERREQRGVLRARHLAAQTAPSASPLGVPHKPLAAFLPAPRPSPAPEARFYTNFSGGSGFGMFVAGEKVFERGWTDPAFASPAAALALHPPGLEGISAMVVEYDAWEGPRALEVRVEREGDAIGGDATAT